jgi:hypothetical protein
MHELTHAWQIDVSTFVPGIICQGLYNQASNTLGASVYGVTDERQWRDYNLEQQGAIVDAWYANGMSTSHKYYRYIKANLLRRSNAADSSPFLTSPTTTATAVGSRLGAGSPATTATTAGSRFGAVNPAKPTTTTTGPRFGGRIP